MSRDAKAGVFYFTVCLFFFLGMLIGSMVGEKLTMSGIVFSSLFAMILILMGMYQWGKRSGR